jgi:hypothetical protein
LKAQHNANAIINVNACMILDIKNYEKEQHKKVSPTIKRPQK